MLAVKAKLLSRIISDDKRSVFFSYENDHTSVRSDLLKIIIEDYDFEYELEIERSYSNNNVAEPLCWKKIKFSKYERHFSGRVDIYMKTANGSCHSKMIFTGSSYERDLRMSEPFGKISLTISVDIFDWPYDTKLTDYTNLNKTEPTDVKFVVGDKEFSAHKHVVSSRSGVFAAMFDSDMMEKKTGRVVVSRHRASCFRTFVTLFVHWKNRYIYASCSPLFW